MDSTNPRSHYAEALAALIKVIGMSKSDHAKLMSDHDLADLSAASIAGALDRDELRFMRDIKPYVLAYRYLPEQKKAATAVDEDQEFCTGGEYVSLNTDQIRVIRATGS